MEQSQHNPLSQSFGSKQHSMMAMFNIKTQVGHFIDSGRHFILKTDQKSVSYMFDKQHSGKIKNEKFLRWRLELSCFSFDIVYRPGRDNVQADTLSRATCAMATEDSLFKLHEALCHPGITRLNHFVRTKNLPCSLNEIKKMTSQCPAVNVNLSTIAKRRFPLCLRAVWEDQHWH